MMGAQLPCPAKYSSLGLVLPSCFSPTVWPISCDAASPAFLAPPLNTQLGVPSPQVNEPTYDTPPDPGAAVLVGVKMHRMRLVRVAALNTFESVVMLILNPE